MTGRVRDMIVDPSQTGKLVEVISSGAYYGMQTFDQALFGHVKAGRVTFEDAMHVASEPTRLQAPDAGRRSQGHHDGRRRAAEASAESSRPPAPQPPRPPPRVASPSPR